MENCVPCFQCDFQTAVCPRAIGAKLQAKAVSSVGSAKPVACFGLPRWGHSHHQMTCHSISVANGDAHLGFADSPSSSLGLCQAAQQPQ